MTFFYVDKEPKYTNNLVLGADNHTILVGMWRFMLYSRFNTNHETSYMFRYVLWYMNGTWFFQINYSNCRILNHINDLPWQKHRIVTIILLSCWNLFHCIFYLYIYFFKSVVFIHIAYYMSYAMSYAMVILIQFNSSSSDSLLTIYEYQHWLFCTAAEAFLNVFHALHKALEAPEGQKLAALLILACQKGVSAFFHVLNVLIVVHLQYNTTGSGSFQPCLRH